MAVTASAREAAAPSGAAHVATVSFLAARASPAGGFWIGLAGGVALARASERRGARQGYGASLAAMLETVAIMGPARLGVPFTQAITAPLLGRLEARRARLLPEILAVAAIRIVHNAATVAFFIFVITGGLEAYTGTYDALGRRVGIEVGTADALAATGVLLLAWAAFASTVQVLVYRRGLRRWPAGGRLGAAADRSAPDPSSSRPRGGPRRGRFDPRAVAMAAAVAFALLLVSTAWAVLAASVAWLALAWAAARPDREAVPTGLALATVLALGSFSFTLGGGLGLDFALRRASRAALLVLVATWLRSAAGAAGLREVFRRALGRLRRLPSLPEAARVLEEIGSEGRLRAAGRSLVGALAGMRKRPLPILDAVLAWVARESARFEPDAPPRPLALRARPVDWALVLLASAPGAAVLLS
jgi:hypothetical protein